MRFADYFGRAFSNVSASQFPWVKLLRESPVVKVADVSSFETLCTLNKNFHCEFKCPLACYLICDMLSILSYKPVVKHKKLDPVYDLVIWCFMY